MSNTTPCKPYENPIFDLVTRQLDEDAAADVQAHCDRCPVCKAFYENILREENRLRHSAGIVRDHTRYLLANTLQNLPAHPETAVSASRRPWPRIAAGLIFALGLAVFLSQFIGPHSSNTAYANILQRLSTARFVSYTIDITPPGYPRERWLGSYAAPATIRHELASGGIIHIHDHETGKTVKLLPDRALAYVLTAEKTGRSPVVPEPKNPFWEIIAAIRGAGNASADTAVTVDDKTINGIQCRGRIVRNGPLAIKAWAPPDSDVPLRIEFEIPVKDKGFYQVVMTDITLNAPQAAQRVNFEIPEHYQVIPVNRKKPD